MIETQNIKVAYEGNGAATSFPYLFPTTFKTDVLVVLREVDGTLTTLVPDIDYQVGGVGSPTSADWVITYPITGSPLANGETLTIGSRFPLTQLVQYENQGGYFPETIEQSLDRLTLITQQQQEQISRAYLVPFGSTDDPTAVPPASVYEDFQILDASEGAVPKIIVNPGNYRDSVGGTTRIPTVNGTPIDSTPRPHLLPGADHTHLYTHTVIDVATGEMAEDPEFLTATKADFDALSDTATDMYQLINTFYVQVYPTTSQVFVTGKGKKSQNYFYCGTLPASDGSGHLLNS